MHALAPLPPTISERLTWEEICERYPNQHVYLVDVQRYSSLHLDIVNARVIGCGPSRRDALEQAMGMHEHFETITYRYTGPATDVLPPPTISDRLTWQQICERYPNQHVYLTEVEADQSRLEILSARVIGSGPTHRAAGRQADAWRNAHTTLWHRFTGPQSSSYRRPSTFIVSHEAINVVPAE